MESGILESWNPGILESWNLGILESYHITAEYVIIEILLLYLCNILFCCDNLIIGELAEADLGINILSVYTIRCRI
jgi:hypothetical protein